MPKKDALKLTPLGLQYLKTEAGVDLFQGASLEFDAPTLAHIYVASTQHWDEPAEFDGAMKSDILELMEALTPILSKLSDRFSGEAPPKRARRVRTGG